MRRQGMFDSNMNRKPPRMGAARPNTVKYTKSRVLRRPQSAIRPDMASNNSSRYINTD